MNKAIFLTFVLCVCVMAGTMKDSRDGKTYKTVKIGNQVWMAENLNYNTKDSYCYDNNSAKCNKYGRLYMWKAAKEACPSGWHLPSKKEFEELYEFAGGEEEIVRKKLKARNGWPSDRGGYCIEYGCDFTAYGNGIQTCYPKEKKCSCRMGRSVCLETQEPYNFNGSDTYGFSVLPAGYYRDDTGNFSSEVDDVFFWSSTDISIGSAYYWYFDYYGSCVSNYYGTNYAFSVRCLRDSNEGSGASSQRSQTQPSSATANQIVSGGDTMTDSRDGMTYKTVKIGEQIWMAQNLNYKTGNSWCYDNNSSNCNKYGRLYDWNTARSACPSGWHLPSYDEWNTLWTAVGGTNTAGTKLKAKNGWNSNGNETDSFGFAVLPAGYRSRFGDFGTEGNRAEFWSSTDSNSDRDLALEWHFFLDNDYVHNGLYYKSYVFSVRCLRNSNGGSGASSQRSQAQPSSATANQIVSGDDTMTDSRDGKTYKTVKIGDQTWMAENLNYNTENSWYKTGNSWCYDNNSSNCNKYGRLYDWNTARSACPSGWHLPSKVEFETLLAKTSAGGGNLQATSWGGTDKYGFSVLPAGNYISEGRVFGNLGTRANFWIFTENNSSRAYSLSFDASDARLLNGNKRNASSVRCLKN